ncbi:MAG: ATP-dependent DNA helicase [Gammaproteobacteria bacterium]|nr:ATP-dependent DNA helicase [Gammaproteobacteria bacterium]
MKSSISVTELAEFVHREGDINHTLEGRVDPIEGVLTQHAYQSKLIAKNPTYEAEKNFRAEYSSHGVSLKVLGRADGVMLKPVPLVEEIKTSRLAPNLVYERLGSVHQAQARLYAAIHCRSNNLDQCTVRLTYVHPDSQESHSLTEDWPAADLWNYFESTCDVYLEFLSEVINRAALRNRMAKDQEFPFEVVSEDQLKVARRAYQSVRDKENMMLEAPTGTGKTVATLYPCVKAMGNELIDRVMFATARTTGKQTAIDTMRILQKQNENLTTVALIAKERICFTPGATCSPDYCNYADGHYDRIANARQDLLARKTIDQSDTELVARAHKVCPYELAMCAAEWADVVIGDYSYVFDPMIALSQLQSRHFRKVPLLVDEAHRLSERVVDMLSVTLEERTLIEVIEARANRTIENLVSRLIHQLHEVALENLSHKLEAVADTVPEQFWKLVALIQQELLDLDLDTTGSVLFECLSTLTRLLNAKDRLSDDYRWIVSNESESIVLSLRCLSPGNWIRSVVKQFRGSIRFSGTLSPPEVYSESHGLDGPFQRSSVVPDKDRYGVMVVPDISTYWRDRPQTVQSLVNLVQTARQSHMSNWLVAFPSYEYLDMVHRQTEGDPSVRKQDSDMSNEERADFICWISTGSRRVGLVTMGGVFTESVDFNSDALAGVIVVGPAIPPSSLERELIRDSSGIGYELAYRQPGMTKVVQAAGRVVRSLNDRGVILLVDPRFTHREIRRYFPQHWLPRIVRSIELGSQLERFWI